MAEQLLSSDPKAGQLLSTDPSAGGGAAAAPRNVLREGRSGGFDDSAPSSGIGQWFEEKLRPLLEQVAHPQTISDIAALLVPDAAPLGATVRAGARGIAATGRGVEQVATSPVVEKAAQMAGAAGAAGEVFHGAPGKAAAIATGAAMAPKAAAATGRVLQRAGGALERAAAEVPTPPRPVVVSPVPAAAAQVAPVVDEFTAARTAKASALPNQKALNEAALAERRAAYQASQQGGAAVATPSAAQAAVAAAEKAGKLRIALNGEESKEFIRLLSRGMSGPDAMAAVKQARDLAGRLGGATAKEVAAAVAHRESTGKW